MRLQTIDPDPLTVTPAAVRSAPAVPAIAPEHLSRLRSVAGTRKSVETAVRVGGRHVRYPKVHRLGASTGLHRDERLSSQSLVARIFRHDPSDGLPVVIAPY